MDAAQELKYLKGAYLNVEQFLPDSHKALFTDPDYAAAYDWWDVIRNAVATLKKISGRLYFPRGRYRVAYSASDTSRNSATGVIDLSPWLNDGVWTPTQDIEIEFAKGAVLFMDNLTGDGYNAQTHAVFARCRWTDGGGAHTPNTWSGNAVGYNGIRLSNVCVEWTPGSARGNGDSFRFTGTKSAATAPYDIVLQDCSAYNAPQVGFIAMGCKHVHMSNFYAENCWADTAHFNACFNGASADTVKAVNCQDDTLALVTYYPDATTLALGLDTEVGPFTSPDQTQANNNGFQGNNITKIGGRANAVRLFGANRASITNVYADANGSGSLDTAVWAGSVKANGTTLAQSGLGCIGCQVTNISARNGVQNAVLIISLGMTGSEGDEWLVNDVSLRGITSEGCAQWSVLGQDTRGFEIDGVNTDSVTGRLASVKDVVLDHARFGGDFTIVGHSTTYDASDMETMDRNDIRLGTVEVNGRFLVQDTRGLIATSISIFDSNASAFEGIRLLDFTCSKMKIINPNRSGGSGLSHTAFRCIPGHRWHVDSLQFETDNTAIDYFFEIGGGDAYNISKDVRVYVVGTNLFNDSAARYTIQGSTYAPQRVYWTLKYLNGGETSPIWRYMNRDDASFGVIAHA